MRYRSLPAECNAEQFREPQSLTARSGSVTETVRQGVVTPLPRGVQVEHRRSGPAVYYVTTAHNQRAYLADGDYVVEEPDGRGFYPVKPDIFEKRWEAAT